jgi:hypothetical protein
MIPERRARSLQPVHMGRSDAGISLRRARAGMLLIRENTQDIGPVAGLRKGGQQGCSCNGTSGYPQKIPAPPRINAFEQRHGDSPTEKPAFVHRFIHLLT